MKLLLDENLSPRLIRLLESDFPGSAHVREVGLRGADDRVVWEYAIAHGLAIVSKDDDFRQRSQLHGHPPKVIWLRVGNVTTSHIARVIADNREQIRAFLTDPEASIMTVP